MPPSTSAEHAPRSCDAALSRAFEFLGVRWNGLILGTIGEGSLGYADLRRTLGISDSTLSDRLTQLAGAGLLTRTVDTGPPVSVSYELSDSGRAVLPALDALMTWARENLTEDRCSAVRAGSGSPARTR